MIMKTQKKNDKRREKTWRCDDSIKAEEAKKRRKLQKANIDFEMHIEHANMNNFEENTKRWSTHTHSL